MKPDDYCMTCMEPKHGAECTRCGHTTQDPVVSAIALPPGTILNGQYMIGVVLGAGGFGVTYIAVDLTLKWKLAIKEYYPAGFGARAPGIHTIAPISTQFKTAFETGLNRFVQEGQALAKFQHHPGVVSVITLFRENGTAYLVMRYEDGLSLKQYLDTRGGHVDFMTVRNIFMRVMDTLRAIHAAGLLHRDISPENIYINDAAQVKLLDFGAAKHDMASKDRSLQITVKRGYSPIEQYTDAPGRQGPWTDVYAVAATIYRALTGETPPESVDRREADRDTLVPPSKRGVSIPRPAERALLRGLAVLPGERFRSVEEFQAAFGASGDTDKRIEPDRRKVVAIFAAAACLVGILALWLGTPDVTFTADRGAIASGQSAVLQWNVARGSVIISPDIGPRVEKSGKIEVAPKETTKYALTSNGFLRRSTRIVTVEVAGAGSPKTVEPPPTYRNPPPVPSSDGPVVISSFRVSPNNVQTGEAVSVAWDVTGAARGVTLQIVPAGPNGPRESLALPQSGTRTITPQRSTTYILAATGSDGKPVTQSASVSVRLARAASSRGDEPSEPVPTPQPRSDPGPGRRVGDPGATRITSVDPPAEPSIRQPSVSTPTGRATIVPVDEHGDPVQAFVEVSQGGRTMLGSFSHSGGVGFSGRVGDYSAKASAEGYEAATISFNVAADGWTRVKIQMHKK